MRAQYFRANVRFAGALSVRQALTNRETTTMGARRAEHAGERQSLLQAVVAGDDVHGDSRETGTLDDTNSGRIEAVSRRDHAMVLLPAPNIVVKLGLS